MKKTILWRTYIAFGVMVLFGIAVLTQSFRLQAVEGAEWRAKADSLSTRVAFVPAERGDIYDDRGVLMATSLPFFTFCIDPTQAPKDTFYKHIDSLSYLMAKHWKHATATQWRDSLVRARKAGRRYMRLKRNLSYHEMAEAKQWPIFNKGRFGGGVRIEESNKRKMPFDGLARRTIGYWRNKKTGAQSVGIEAAFDSVLRGVDGQQLMQKAAGSRMMPIETLVEPVDGFDLVTSIDINMQDIANTALLRGLKKHNASYGVALVMEVETGAIKAIANLSENGEGRYTEQLNNAIGTATEHGSTFKLASMIAFLEDEKVKLTDEVAIHQGELMIAGRKMKDSERHGLDRVTVQHGFEISSNVMMAKLALEHYKSEPKKFVERLQALGLHQKKEVEILGEPTPVIRHPDDKLWSATSLPWMSIGYEHSLTPLQMLALYNTVANDGRYVQPYLVNGIARHGDIKEDLRPDNSRKRVISKSVVRQVQICLEGVVENGTAKRLRNENFGIAGKTGTAQIADRQKGYYQRVYQASFAGYFPTDEPKYSCIVLVNTPRNGQYYGSGVAAPIFGEIANKIFAQYVSDDEKSAEEERQLFEDGFRVKGKKEELTALYKRFGVDYNAVVESEWVQARPVSGSFDFIGIDQADGLVPDVRGMGMRDAVYLLESRGFNVGVEGVGKVIRQSLRPATKASKGAWIKVRLR